MSRATESASFPHDLVRISGKTTYLVRVHFSNTSNETMEDKIRRMLKNEIRGVH